MPTKIESHLSPEALHEFFKRCAQTKGGTKLATIQAIAEEFGVTISLMSAAAVRDGALGNYLSELKAKSERAQQVAAFAREGLSMSDAASVRLAETVFDDLMSPTAASLTAEERDTYSKIIARARLGDQRAAKLEADLKLRDEQLAKLNREKTEWEEQRAKIQAAASALQKTTDKPKAAPDEIRKQAVALIDEVMGIKPKAKAPAKS